MKRDNFWFAFEPNRWLSNEKLALVSLGAKGLWIHLLCLMYKAEAEGKLTINGNACSTDQLLAIWNNLAMWAGTADSGELRGKVLFYYARAIEREKK